MQTSMDTMPFTMILFLDYSLSGIMHQQEGTYVANASILTEESGPNCAFVGTAPASVADKKKYKKQNTGIADIEYLNDDMATNESSVEY